MLNERISRMREKLWDTRPCITAERLVLATEAYKQFAGEVPPIFRAKVTEHVMENMTTLIMDDELIVGTATDRYRGANLFPEFQSSSWYISDIDDFPVRSKDPYDITPEDREKILETLPYWEGKSMEDLSKKVIPPHIRECMSDDIITVGLTNGVSGETVCDHAKLLRVGLRGYIDECKANIEKTIPKCKEDQEKINYWTACIIQSEALITYAHRMADEAERQASECSDEKRKKELLTIAENCRTVPENPPENFWQALQLLWFVHVYFHIEVCTTACSFGRFDQYMWPFYRKTVVEEKAMTEEEAMELLPTIGAAMREWSAHPARTEARHTLLRALHTFKGSSRLAGAMRLGEMAHRLESAVEALDAETASAERIDPLFARLFADRGQRTRLLREHHQSVDFADQQVFDFADLFGGVPRGGYRDFEVGVGLLQVEFRLLRVPDHAAGPAVVGGRDRDPDPDLLCRGVALSAGGQRQRQQRRRRDRQKLFHSFPFRLY